MADLQSIVAEAPQPVDNNSTHAELIPPPIRRDTYSSDRSELYKPLPEGRWVVPFHGNCPRCHHHHSAAQVKIKVTQDSNHISRVDCEKCHERWIAIGGRNATMISLLSVTSSESDSIMEGVRYSLIDVVREVTRRAAFPLGTVPEQSPHPDQGPSTYPERILPHGSPPTPKSSDVAAVAASTSSAPSPAVHECRQHSEPVSPSRVGHPIVRKRGSGPHRMLSKLKSKLMSRFPGVYNKNLKRPLGPASRQPKMSARQFEKSPVRIPSAADHHVAGQLPTTQNHSNTISVPPMRQDIPEPDTIRPSQRLAEVLEFIAGLDKSGLEAKTEQERSAWMREVYTEFKRNRKNKTPVHVAALLNASIQRDLYGTGAHIFDVEGVDNPETSITISEQDSDSQLAHEDVTPASFLRHSRQQFLQRVRRGSGPQRPQSMPSPPRLPVFAHPNVRNSFHGLMHRRSGSISSLQGQASSRWSQDSPTLLGSTPDLQESLSEMERQRDDDGDRIMDDAEMPPPPPPPTSREDEDPAR